MKVILKKEVVDIGGYGETVKVARGYARNYLIPKGLAVEATPGNLKQLDAEREAYHGKLAAQKEAADKLAGELEAVSLSFERKVGEDDKLFGSVTTHDIEEALKSKGLQNVEKKDITLEEPVKKIGSYTAAVKLHQEVSVKIKLEVVGESTA